jgi:hypothetical protein|uniref:Uncharacterized protein n=1 Tax=Zea mays TaxID=4577 RepID=A0A804P1E2_MAIZE
MAVMTSSAGPSTTTHFIAAIPLVLLLISAASPSRCQAWNHHTSCHVFSSRMYYQEIMSICLTSDYILLACTLVGSPCPGATQPQPSLLGTAPAVARRGPSLRVRCYNLYSEEECSNRYCHSVCVVRDRKYRQGAYCAETRWECCCPH